MNDNLVVHHLIKSEKLLNYVQTYIFDIKD